MRARPFQPARLADVGGLIEAGLEFDQRGHRLAGLGRLAQRIDDGAVAAGAIQRLLDRQHVRVARRLRQIAHDHVEGLVGVMQQHVLLADRRKHVAVMVLDPLGDTGGEGGPHQVAAAVQHQFAQIGHAQQALDLDHLVGADLQLLHDQAAQAVGGAGGDLQTDDAAATAPLQRGLELADQVLGLLLDLQIAVAQHAEAAMARIAIAGKQAGQMHQQQILQPQEPLPARQGHEPRQLRGDRQQRLHLAAIGLARQLQRQRKARVRDEGERVRGVDGQGRQDRKDEVLEMAVQELLLGAGQALAGQDDDARLLHLLAQRVPDALLRAHQAARVGVDQGQLFRRCQAVIRGRGAALAHQFAQAGHADGVELVQVRGADRHEAQALQQRHARIARLVQDAPVERQPGQLAVEEPCGAFGNALGQGLGFGERRAKKIGLGHDRPAAGVDAIMRHPRTACPAGRPRSGGSPGPSAPWPHGPSPRPVDAPGPGRDPCEAPASRLAPQARPAGDPRTA